MPDFTGRSLFGGSPDEAQPPRDFTPQDLEALIALGRKLIKQIPDPSPEVVVCAESDRTTVYEQFRAEGWHRVPGVGENPRSVTFIKEALMVECHFDKGIQRGQSLVLPKSSRTLEDLLDKIPPLNNQPRVYKEPGEQV